MGETLHIAAHTQPFSRLIDRISQTTAKGNLNIIGEAVVDRDDPSKSPSAETKQYTEVRQFDYQEDKGKMLNADSVILMAEGRQSN